MVAKVGVWALAAAGWLAGCWLGPGEIREKIDELEDTAAHTGDTGGQ